MIDSFLNTLLIVISYEAIKFMIELGKKKIIANQEEKGKLAARIDLEPELRKLLNQVDEMFTSKMEHLKGYIDASKHINLSKIDELNDIISSIKESYYVYLNSILPKFGRTEIEFTDLIKMQEMKEDLLVHQRKFKLNIENDELNKLLIEILSKTIDEIEMPYRDFKTKEAIVNSLYESGYDENGDAFASIDSTLYSTEIQELNDAKDRYLKSKTITFNEVIELFRKFNFQCKNYLNNHILPTQSGI